MELCEKHFNRKGYSVEDTSAREPYDFRIKKDNREYLVEVKGLQTEADKIILTKNEVELSRQQRKKMILFLVHSIKLNKKPEV